MINYYEEKYRDLFVRAMLKNPLLVFGFSFMLRCIWDEQEKRHIEWEDVEIKCLYGNKRKAGLIVELIQGVYKATEPHTDANRYTNLYLLVEKKGLFGKIVVNHFLKNEV